MIRADEAYAALSGSTGLSADEIRRVLDEYSAKDIAAASAKAALAGGNGGPLPEWFQSGEGLPAGAVTPTQTGALYKDLDGSVNKSGLYIAVGPTSADWVCLGGDGDSNVPGISYDNSGDGIILIAPDDQGTQFEVQRGGVSVPYSDAYTRFQNIVLRQVSPGLGHISSDGPLPTVSLVSGTGAQIDTGRDVETHTPVTLTSAAGTCKAELAPVGQLDFPPEVPAYQELFTIAPKVDAAVVDVCVRVPVGWFLKLTVTNATLGTTTYY